MTRRSIVLASLLGAVALIIAFVSYRKSSEPTYQGKRVIEWALELNGPQDTTPATRFFLEAPPEVVPVLARALSQEESVGKRTALSAGRWMPERMRGRLHRLVGTYERDHRRTSAAYALELMGTNAIAALPQLSEALHDFQPAVRFRAGRALGRIGPAALPALIAAIEDGTSTAQIAAMQGLSLMGTEAAEAVPALIKALELPSVRTEACNTLVGIGRPAALPLCATLQHTNVVVQSFALAALARMGPLARPAIPELTKALEDPSLPVRSAVVHAITAIESRGD